MQFSYFGIRAMSRKTKFRKAAPPPRPIFKKNRPINTTFLKLLVVCSFLVCSFFSITSYAQTPRDQDKLIAVLNIVNHLLLQPQEQQQPLVQLNFGEIDNNTYTVIEDFSFSFEQAGQDIELCFVIDQLDASLNFSINDIEQNLIEGENCFFVPQANQLATNQVAFSGGNTTISSQLSIIDVATSNPSDALLPSLTRSQWNEVAVRKVLKIFAFGGHARDSQIRLWANMRPDDAIREMLNFSQHNHLLSPLAENEKYDATFDQHGTFESFIGFISDESSSNAIPIDRRRFFNVGFFRFDESFIHMATVRGLNPFRQRIGFWETNYHLATNREASVSSEQMMVYYDLIMQAHESGVPYYQVMGEAAKSAAAAMQYGHRLNRWNESTQECRCNDDFAREIHQLYYGIFGEDDSTHHENVTIPETAKMLTGMPVPFLVTPNFVGFSTQVLFDEGIEDEDHHLGSVNILNQSITGADAAQKIDNLMPISMQHPESLKNLPIMIISTLADDNLTPSKIEQLRASWASLGVNRTLLEFLQSYAISDLFHDDQQLKYLTSHERAIYIANRRNLDNVESFTSGANYEGRKGFNIDRIIEIDAAGSVFSPLRNVFGGQTSLAASDSAMIFENNYNSFVDRENYERTVTLCDNCDIGGDSWEKKWADVLPTREDGNYYVEDAAAWLWNHVVGSTENYTELERAHLYALLGAFTIDSNGNDDGEFFIDFNYLMCIVADYQAQESASDAPIFDILRSTNWYGYPYCREQDGLAEHELEALNAGLTGDQIANDPMIQSILAQLGSSTIALNEPLSSERDESFRRYALRRIDNAIDFIFTTPFIFAEASE